MATGALVLGAGPAAAAQQPSADRPVDLVTAGGTFGEYEPGAAASTYDPELVPEGAKAHVFSLAAKGVGTGTTLAVSGLVPEREYGAHVHTKPCGETGKAAGPHFQHIPAPEGVSGDPSYANPENEIWLDFTTGPAGNGFAHSKVDWRVGERDARSVVIHETHTSTAPGSAGDAGSRLACLNVAF